MHRAILAADGWDCLIKKHKKIQDCRSTFNTGSKNRPIIQNYVTRIGQNYQAVILTDPQSVSWMGKWCFIFIEDKCI